MTIFDAMPPHDVPHARRRDPITSARAGVEIEQKEGQTTTFKPGTTKHVALHWIALRPMTANDVVRLSHRPGIWKRVSDLKNAGLIIGIDVKPDPVTKQGGIVWQMTERGRRVLVALDRGENVRL